MNIVIRGASKGIGYELCRKFIVTGNHNIVAISRSNNPYDNQVMSYNANDQQNFTYLKFDLTNSKYSESLIPSIIEKLPSIDIIINNAGLLINKPFSMLTDNDFDSMFNLNVKSVFRLTRDLLPIMNNGGHIVNISSMGGFQGSYKFPGLSLYSASKGALAIFTECLAEELKSENISANALALGAVQTEMLVAAFPNYKAPLKADEMAEFIYDFALNGNKYYNGKILPISVSTP